MDGDIGDILQSVLSDPGQMEKIGRLAQGLMGGGGEGPTAEPPPSPSPVPQVPTGGGEDKLLEALGKAFSGSFGQTRSTALLTAMRPYMRPEKQEKLDRALKIARMARAAGVVMGELGGYGV